MFGYCMNCKDLTKHLVIEAAHCLARICDHACESVKKEDRIFKYHWSQFVFETYLL
jgi:hypothetical protein